MGCLGWRFIPIFVLCLRILFIFFLVCSSELIPLALSNYPVEISISKKGSASGHLVANELFESIPHKKYTAQLKNLESPVRSPTNPTSRSKKKSEPEWNHSRTKKFSEKLKSFTSWAWNWLLNFFAKKTNKVEDESIRSNKSKEHQAGHLFAQSKFLPIEEIPFYEAIEPYCYLQAISPENDPDMLIRRQVAFLLGKPVAKIKPQALDLQKENSIAETLLTEMTNPHRTIAQREAEYRIFVHLLRCTDDVNVRSKIEKIYTRNKGVQKSLKYGSIQAYVYSLKDKKNPEVQNLGNYMISFCESARWGEVVPDVEYMNKSQDLAYKILRSKNITILQKIPALKVLRILQCFDMGTDMTFREEISKDNYLLSVYALISYEEQPQKLSNKFNFNSWDHVALSEPNVAREFDRIKQAEAHGISSMFKKNPDITWEVKESDSRLKLMDSLVNLMLNNSKNYVQLLKLKEKYSIFFSKGWSEAHNIDLFPNDSFLLFRSADLEVREKVWLFKALDHFRNFGDTKMKEIVIRGLETEAENLTEVHNHLLMNKIILKNGAIQSLEFVNQKALVFRKLKYNTKIAELVSEVTLGEEIEGILFELKNQWSPLSSSKLQLYMILEHLVNNFPAIRDPEYWENMGKKFREPTIIKILKSLGQIANRDDSLSWMRSIGKGPVETDPQKTAGKNQLLELLCPEMDELQNFLATPLTGFGIGIYPDFSLDISFLKNLESKNPHTRAGIIYNGPAEKLQRRILIKTLKNNSSEDCRWMHNLANYMKKLNLITYWEKDTLNPINTPTLTTCLLSYLDSSNRSTSEGVILYRVLEHLMNNNLNVQSTVLEALRNDESLSHKLDQFYYMSLFENIGGNNIRTSILNLNEISMTVVNSPDNIRHDFVDSFFKQLSSILKSQQPPLQQSEVRVCALMIHYLYSRKVISPEEWISVLKMTPEIDEQILEIRLVLDSVEFPPLLEKLEENLTAKRFHKGLSER
ncbi:hypothetical protein BY996DRAFT_7272715 [Phakopsora pachyrhizi]|nr:hypothetical protein BY996DRAFT_7272715 [Phakopsora pachyrhizi]